MGRIIAEMINKTFRLTFTASRCKEYEVAVPKDNYVMNYIIKKTAFLIPQARKTTSLVMEKANYRPQTFIHRAH